MKIQLVKEIDTELNIWYKIVADGTTNRAYGVYGSDEEVIKKQAEIYFEKFVKNAPDYPKSEILKEIEI